MKFLCQMCGANLKFVPSAQKACCEHCGNVYETETIEYDDSIYDECEQYTCSSCGAELLSFDKTGVINCLYCGGKEFVKGKWNKEYILEGILPFKVDRDEFIKCYEEYFNFVEDIDQNFLNKVKQANVKSMYLPYSFANNFFRKQYSKEFNEILEEVIPFDFRELKKMNPIYLDNSLAEIIKTKKEENDIKTDDTTFYWVPIWYAEIEYEHIKYYIVMNGQTMEIAGYCNSSILDKKYKDKIVIEKNVMKKILKKKDKSSIKNKPKAILPIISSILSLLVFFLAIFVIFMMSYGIGGALVILSPIYIFFTILFLKIYYDTLRDTRIKIGEKTFCIISYKAGKFHLTPNINKYRNTKR